MLIMLKVKNVWAAIDITWQGKQSRPEHCRAIFVHRKWYMTGLIGLLYPHAYNAYTIKVCYQRKKESNMK